MSKRRINKQQSARIEKIQANYRNQPPDSGPTEEGLVITRFKKHAIVENKVKELTHCSIRPNIDSLVAGDRVIFQKETATQGIVLSRYPRETILGRPDRRGEFKAVAANVSQLIIVAAVKPEISWSLLDSYLVMAEYLNLKACIVLNKVDLPNAEEIKDELTNIYSSLGYQVLFLSKEDAHCLKTLEATLNHETSVFVGQSGVGKSSLIAKILPHETSIAIGEISELAELGKHTTSNSTFYHLPSGGALIDSPGVREFGLISLPMNQLLQTYPEFRPLIGHCKFRNCSHKDSLGCAIVKAVAENRISQKRYDNFIKLAYPAF